MANLPMEFEVRRAIAGELTSSDGMVVADRPLKGAAPGDWIAYRQALRDLSKPHDIDDPTRRPTPVEMVRAWPLLPDGSDPIKHLRERIG